MIALGPVFESEQLSVLDNIWCDFSFPSRRDSQCSYCKRSRATPLVDTHSGSAAFICLYFEGPICDAAHIHLDCYFIKSQEVNDADCWSSSNTAACLSCSCSAASPQRVDKAKTVLWGQFNMWWCTAGKCCFPPLLSWVENTDLLCNETDNLSEKSLTQREVDPLPVTLVLMLC